VPKGSDVGALLRDREWWFRDIVIALIIGSLLSIGSIVGQKLIDDARAERDAAKATAQAQHAEQLENLVFVRSLSSPDPETARPFGHFDLRGMSLVGLQLAGADFAYADMTDTTLVATNFSGADFSEANLTGADLRRANMTGARLSDDRYGTAHSSESGARLIHANLVGTDLTGADLTGADLDDVYYDASTRWPANYRPPPSRAEP
jgi:uncharacterized protein YjbI with pentapeptide repeats